MGLTDLLERHGVTQAELAHGLNMKRFTLNKKLRLHRRWQINEAFAVVAFLRVRLNKPRLTVEKVFGDRAA